MLAWHLFCGKLRSPNGGSIGGRLLMLRWRGEEYSLADVPYRDKWGLCVSLHLYKHVFEHACVLWYVRDCRYRGSLREPSPWELHPSGRKALEEAFHTFKLQALKSKWLIDSSIEAELTPSFRLNVLPLWGWIPPSRLWLNLMVKFVHTSFPFCCFNVAFISEMCCL